jgi:hypothetical protein
MGRHKYSRRTAIAALVLPATWMAASPTGTQAAGPNVLRVGTYNSIPGTFSTIQAAVNAAQPGDWILVGPGDYHESQDYTNDSQPAGVWIDKSNVHLRGMDRNAVIVDGTKGTAAVPCSADPADQDPGPNNQGRNGIEVFGVTEDSSGNVTQRFLADGVSVDNLTVCNFLTGSGGNGNEIWWNGGDGTGRPNAPSIGLRGYEGTNLTATSTYSNTTNGSIGPCCGTGFPAASYGIFSSNATGPANGPANGVFSHWTDSYASNQADSDFYVGGCWQRCDTVLTDDHGQYSSLCLSSTNAGGYFVTDHLECDLNKDGPVSNSQNNDDAPSPQIGLCDSADPTTEPQTGLLGSASCTVWTNGLWHDNNVANVPGNGNNGLAGAGPVGTGVILAGTTYSTLYKNKIYNNDAWGELTVDLPDPESGPAMCQGGTDVVVPQPVGEVCYYRALGNLSLDNVFTNNGNGFPGQIGPNVTNGDIALASLPNTPGNCYSGDTDTGGTLTSDPPAVETNPLYAPDPTTHMCTNTNAGDEGPLVVEAECASQLLAPCPTIQSAVCQLWPGPGPCPLPVVPTPAANYPHADASFCYQQLNGFCSLMDPLSDSDHTLTPTMANPCGGVPSDPSLAPPANPWCPAVGTATPEVPFAALPVAAGGLALAAWLAVVRPRFRKKDQLRA